MADAPSRKYFGIVLLIGTTACFPVSDSGAKWLMANSSVALAFIIAFRYLVAFLIVAALLRPWANAGLLHTRQWKLQILRGLLLLGSTACGWTGLKYLTLMQSTSIVFAAPLLIAALAGPLLGEWPGIHRVAAIVAGFAGVLIVTRPGSPDGLPIQALLAVATAIQNALVAIITRKLAAFDAAETTMFYSTLVGAILVLPVFFAVPVPAFGVERSDLVAWGLLGGAAIVACAAQWFLVLAHKYASASVLAPFFYMQLLFAAAMSFVVFRNLPDAWTVTGAAIVAASGLYVLHRERVRQVPPSME